jgi:Fe2+ transport system protein FeoA
MLKHASRALTDIERDGEFVVDSVSDQDATLLKRLKVHGITPGARLRVTKSRPEELVLRAGSGSKPLHLPLSAAGAVRIRSTI